MQIKSTAYLSSVFEFFALFASNFYIGNNAILMAYQISNNITRNN